MNRLIQDAPLTSSELHVPIQNSSSRVGDGYQVAHIPPLRRKPANWKRSGAELSSNSSSNSEAELKEPSSNAKPSSASQSTTAIGLEKTNKRKRDQRNDRNSSEDAALDIDMEGTSMWLSSRSPPVALLNSSYLLPIQRLFYYDPYLYDEELSLQFLHQCSYSVSDALTYLIPSTPYLTELDDSDLFSLKESSEDICCICSDGGNLIICEYKYCIRVYHVECAGLDEVPMGKEKWECPIHTCVICGKKTEIEKYENEGKLVCSTCPTAYCAQHAPIIRNSANTASRTSGGSGSRKKKSSVESFRCTRCFAKASGDLEIAKWKAQFLRNLKVALASYRPLPELPSTSSLPSTSGTALSTNVIDIHPSSVLLHLPEPSSPSSSPPPLLHLLPLPPLPPSAFSLSSPKSPSSASKLSSSSSFSFVPSSSSAFPPTPPVDVEMLYREITARGGLEKILKSDQWQHVDRLFFSSVTIELVQPEEDRGKKDQTHKKRQRSSGSSKSSSSKSSSSSSSSNKDSEKEKEKKAKGKEKDRDRDRDKEKEVSARSKD